MTEEEFPQAVARLIGVERLQTQPAGRIRGVVEALLRRRLLRRTGMQIHLAQCCQTRNRAAGTAWALLPGLRFATLEQSRQMCAQVEVRPAGEDYRAIRLSDGVAAPLRRLTGEFIQQVLEPPGHSCRLGPCLGQGHQSLGALHHPGDLPPANLVADIVALRPKSVPHEIQDPMHRGKLAFRFSQHSVGTGIVELAIDKLLIAKNHYLHHRGRLPQQELVKARQGAGLRFRLPLSGPA